jgi:DNA-binding CsgD family transcriptional regulator
MIHIIIILHFLCLAIGVGFISLSWMLYKRDKIMILKHIVIVEILFSILFFIDTIGVYIRKILVQYKIDNVIKVINYVLVLALIVYVYKTIKKIKAYELYKKLNMQMKVIIAIIKVTSLLLLFSYKVKFLQSVPYLCIIYFLQCLLGLVCIKEKKEIIHEESKEIIHEESKDLKCLTNREKEIVDYICRGLSNKEIGEKLFISANTVKNHVYNIYKKVNVKNKVELINLVNKVD